MHYYTSYMLLFYLIFAPSLDLSLSLSFILLILAVAVEPISSEKNDIYLCTFRTHTKRHFLPPSCVPCCSFYFGTSIQTLRVIFIVCTLLLHCSVFLQIVTSIYVCVARVCVFVCLLSVWKWVGWVENKRAFGRGEIEMCASVFLLLLWILVLVGSVRVQLIASGVHQTNVFFTCPEAHANTERSATIRPPKLPTTTTKNK